MPGTHTLGLRVHGQPGHDQGTPRPLGYEQDGYLHEKWAIFSDGREALFISGSLNESQTTGSGACESTC